MIEPIKRVIKLCLITGTLILFSSAVHAQIMVGARLGANINQFNQPGTIFGFNGGAFARYQVMDFVSARGELTYNQQGGARSGYTRDLINTGLGETFSSVTYTNRYVNLNNLEIAAIAEITHPDFIEETVMPKLLIGLAYGYLISANESAEKTYNYNTSNPSATGLTSFTISDTHENVRSNYQHGQLGFIVGMAVDYKVGERTFTTEVRYRKSINQLHAINNITQVPGEIGDLYTTTISLNFAMTLFNF